MKQLNTYITEKILISKNTEIYKLNEDNQRIFKFFGYVFAKYFKFFGYVFAKYELCTMVYDLEHNVFNKWQDIFEWMLEIIEKPSKNELLEFDKLSSVELLYMKTVLRNMCKDYIDNDLTEEIKQFFIKGFIQYKDERDKK